MATADTLARQSSARQDLLATAESILDPLVDFLMRGGLGANAVKQALIKCYVRSASQLLSDKGMSPTTSRVALLSELTRAEVASAFESREFEDHADPMLVHDLATILNVWHTDDQFCIPFGAMPRELDIVGRPGRPCFADLVRVASPKRSSSEMLQRLVASGVVQIIEEKTVRALSRAFKPREYDSAAVAYIGQQVSGLLRTFRRNSNASVLKVSKFTEKSVKTDHPIEVRREPEVSGFVSERAMELLRSVDDWFVKHADADCSVTSSTAHYTVSVFLSRSEDGSLQSVQGT
ncbi:MAG: DUF6502 family protein [Steroidobacteraceae bacterium]